MKTLFAVAALSFATSTVFAQTASERAEAFYRQGLAAEKAGDPAAAQAAYLSALELFPNHANARYRANEVEINASSIKSAATEAKIGGVKIPTYELEDATVQEAIEALGLSIEKASDGQIAPNFVIEDPKGKLADARISLRLKNLPAKAILGYIHSMANTKARYDEHAVVISSR